MATYLVRWMLTTLNLSVRVVVMLLVTFVLVAVMLTAPLNELVQALSPRDGNS
jgi:hypothetical protein